MTKQINDFFGQFLMETIKAKQDSKLATFLAEHEAKRKAICQYINGQITLAELEKQGVKLEQPVKLN